MPRHLVSSKHFKVCLKSSPRQRKQPLYLNSALNSERNELNQNLEVSPRDTFNVLL